jgi:hypothetical protein
MSGCKNPWFGRHNHSGDIYGGKMKRTKFGKVEKLTANVLVQPEGGLQGIESFLVEMARVSFTPGMTQWCTPGHNRGCAMGKGAKSSPGRELPIVK